jgi:hypothetical protein
MPVVNLYGMAFNGDAFFPLQVHIIQYLVHHIPFADGFGMLQQSVGQGAFTVVNMSDDAKIPDILHVNALAPAVFIAVGCGPVLQAYWYFLGGEGS